jgi:RNA polymerase sigma-70 factor (ECF subfamily)
MAGLGESTTVDCSALPPNELLSRCTNSGDAAAWQEFIRRFNPLIAHVMIRVGSRYGESSSSVIDDLVQDTYLKICVNECKLLKAFEFQHPESIYGFLKVVASNVAHDYFKSRLAQKRDSGREVEHLDDPSIAVSSPDSTGSPARIERAVLIRQIDQQISISLPPIEIKRARMVFWLYYRAGFSASAIASLPSVGLTTKGVESLLFRLTRIVRENLKVDPASESSKAEKGLRQAESF